jgi:hypothetical protein
MLSKETKKWLKIDQTAHLKKYRVLSPDNIDINYEGGYNTLKEAKAGLKQWVSGYQKQGYYSQVCYNGYVRQISLDLLPGYCDIIKI